MASLSDDWCLCHTHLQYSSVESDLKWHAMGNICMVCFMPVKPHINCLVLTTHFSMCTYDGMSLRVGNNVSIYKLDFDSS